jgi:hypothetical protein
MMLKLNEILSNNNTININDVYDFFTSTTDIFIIKYDGVRDFRKYNVIIIGKESRFETINFEIEDLQEGIRKALTIYKKFI